MSSWLIIQSLHYLNHHAELFFVVFLLYVEGCDIIRVQNLLSRDNMVITTHVLGWKAS